MGLPGPLFLPEMMGKGDKMKCDLCEKEADALVHLRVYSPAGILVCADCYSKVDEHRHKPYSKVMDSLALAEAGYYANRKRARR